VLSFESAAWGLRPTAGFEVISDKFQV